MSHVYILIKDGKCKHTYSGKLLVKYIEEGWKEVCSVYGWNMSVGYPKNNELEKGK